MARQSNWIFREVENLNFRLYLSNSHWIFPLTTGFGVEQSARECSTLRVSDESILTSLMDLSEEKLYLTPFPFSPLFPMLIMSLATQKQAPITKTSFKSEYDYIIVGGGAAGSVLANRLSEIPCVNVLLLEAGKPAPKVTDIPSAAASFVQSDIDWRYRTTPQRHTGSALINRV
ncbi:hypothetical protein AVEN_132896-1 [Araneus ventricosus]|uniref:Uncharacterized protein n=1 Tax=Araneus ventricosus TaxID=182803 RepID=A0A4Y2IR49_ARAVE|nr:hypothetical protein AVEN_132896-1 [Araneus ventricosus]